MFKVTINKENLKFSSSHFTIFNETESERLHGHNYYIAVIFEFSNWNESNSLTANFSELKEIIKTECDLLDEKVLLPQKSPHLKFTHETNGVWVQFVEKKYFFPKEDLAILPVTNITSEALARHLTTKIESSSQHLNDLTSIEVEVTETRGQTASFKTQVRSTILEGTQS